MKFYIEWLPEVNFFLDGVTDFYNVCSESSAVALFAGTRVLVFQAGLEILLHIGVHFHILLTAVAFLTYLN